MFHGAYRRRRASLLRIVDQEGKVELAGKKGGRDTDA